MPTAGRGAIARIRSGFLCTPSPLLCSIVARSGHCYTHALCHARPLFGSRHQGVNRSTGEAYMVMFAAGRRHRGGAAACGSVGGDQCADGRD